MEGNDFVGLMQLSKVVKVLELFLWRHVVPWKPREIKSKPVLSGRPWSFLMNLTFLVWEQWCKYPFMESNLCVECQLDINGGIQYGFGIADYQSKCVIISKRHRIRNPHPYMPPFLTQGGGFSFHSKATEKTSLYAFLRLNFTNKTAVLHFLRFLYFQWNGVVFEILRFFSSWIKLYPCS